MLNIPFCIIGAVFLGYVTKELGYSDWPITKATPV